MAQVREFLRVGPTGTVVHPAPTATVPLAVPADPGATQRFTGAVPPVVTREPIYHPGAPATPAAPPEPARANRAGGSNRWRPGRATWLVATAALLLVGIIAWAALSDGSGGHDPAKDVGPAPSTGSPSTGSPSTGSTSSSSPSSSPTGSTGPATPAAPTAAGMKGFIADYLATVTEDPDTAFTMLTPAFQRQSGGISGYKGFWDTIARADLGSISADPKDLTVTYDVEYTRRDGSQVAGHVSLDLVHRHGRYLIAGES